MDMYCFKISTFMCVFIFLLCFQCLFFASRINSTNAFLISNMSYPLDILKTISKNTGCPMF